MLKTKLGDDNNKSFPFIDLSVVVALICNINAHTSIKILHLKPLLEWCYICFNVSVLLSAGHHTDKLV